MDDSLSLTDDSRQLSTMLLHSAPSGKGLAGRSLLDFFAKEDHTRISEQFQSSIASESTSVMALNADMLDSDQNHVKVELFHAQFQNLANKRSFLLGVREIQGGETVDPMTKASPSVDSCPAIGTPGALSVVFDVPSFEILVLSEDLEMLCQSCLGKTPENVVEISSVSKRKEFAGVLQTMTNHSFHSADADAGHAKEQTFTFNLLGAGEVTASFLAEYLGLVAWSRSTKRATEAWCSRLHRNSLRWLYKVNLGEPLEDPLAHIPKLAASRPSRSGRLSTFTT